MFIAEAFLFLCPWRW